MDKEPWVADTRCIEKAFAVAAERARHLAVCNACDVRVVRAFRDNEMFTVEIPASLYKAILARDHWQAGCEGDESYDVAYLEKECESTEQEFHRIQCHDADDIHPITR